MQNKAVNFSSWITLYLSSHTCTIILVSFPIPIPRFSMLEALICCTCMRKQNSRARGLLQCLFLPVMKAAYVKHELQLCLISWYDIIHCSLWWCPGNRYCQGQQADETAVWSMSVAGGVYVYWHIWVEIPWLKWRGHDMIECVCIPERTDHPYQWLQIGTTNAQQGLNDVGWEKM